MLNSNNKVFLKKVIGFSSKNYMKKTIKGFIAFFVTFNVIYYILYLYSVSINLLLHCIYLVRCS